MQGLWSHHRVSPHTPLPCSLSSHLPRELPRLINAPVPPWATSSSPPASPWAARWLPNSSQLLLLDLGILEGKQPSGSFQTGLGEVPGASPELRCAVSLRPAPLFRSADEPRSRSEVSERSGRWAFPEMPPWAGEALPRSVRMTQDEEEQREGGGGFQRADGKSSGDSGRTERRSADAARTPQIHSQFSH